MTKEDAKKLADQRVYDTEAILGDIKAEIERVAVCGCYSLSMLIPKELSMGLTGKENSTTSIVNQLIELGYAVQVNDNNITIDWT